MKKYLTIALLIILIPGPAISIERSGEIIRELMNDIDDQMTAMENKSKILVKSKKSLEKSLGKDFSAFETETDPG